MIWLRKLQICKIVAFVLMVAELSACGVKGDPLPPEKPPELGRGRPTYRRATEGIPLQKHKEEDDEDESNQGSGNDESE